MPARRLRFCDNALALAGAFPLASQGDESNDLAKPPPLPQEQRFTPDPTPYCPLTPRGSQRATSRKIASLITCAAELRGIGRYGQGVNLRKSRGLERPDARLLQDGGTDVPRARTSDWPKVFFAAWA